MNLLNTEIFPVLLRTTIIFMVLLTLARLLGKKQLSQLTYFNYVTGITIGSISGSIIGQGNEPFTDEFAGLIWWCLLTISAGYISSKWRKFKLLVDDKPTILINKGKIMKDELSSYRLSMDDLSMLLRNHNVFSITEVEYAILEPNGALSVIKKAPHQPITRADMNIETSSTSYIPSKIIVHGKLIEDNLEELSLDKEWVEEQLREQDINSIKDVFYAEIQKDGSLFVDTY